MQESLQKKDNPLKKITNQIKDSAQASHQVGPPQHTQPQSSTESSYQVHQKSPQQASKVSKSAFESPSVFSGISTSQDQLATTRPPMNPANAPGVPPPKMVPSPAKPPANSTVTPGTLPRAP